MVPALELPHDSGVAAVPLLYGCVMTPAEARSSFPVLASRAYLNAGSVGPLSRRTFEAMQSAEQDALEQGRAAASVWEGAAARETALRERLAALIRVPPEKLVLTTSTTEGCNLVVTGLRLRPEDEVVTTDAEHPGLLMPLLASGARVKQAGVLQRPAGEALAAILAEVTPQTRLIALSHVLWLNGHVLPLAEIKRATGLPLLVDGAQSVGAIPVDASVAEWYTVSGQKWLCGPEMTGALYVADHERLRPQVQSYAASARTDAGRLALVHFAPALMAGLLAAVADVPDWGFERAAELVMRCREALLGVGVEVRTEPRQGTLISFRVAVDPAAVVKAAEEKGIIIRNLPDGWLRASIGWWNDEADIARLVDFVGESS
jgi:L-cysteine/cystine lyase